MEAEAARLQGLEECLGSGKPGYILGLYIGIMEKKMETTIIYRVLSGSNTVLV